MIEKCLDLKIVDFRQQINKLVSSCDLDAGIVYYIIKDVFYEVEKQYHKIVRDEHKQWEEWNQQLLEQEQNIELEE